MKELEQKHVAAQAAFEDAKNALIAARLEYIEGAGKTYAESAGRVAEIERLITEQEQIRDGAKQDLADRLRETPSEVSAGAKNALAARRNAEDLLEQYQVIQKEAAALAKINLAEASDAARSYMSAYDTAALAWADVNVYMTLIDCGERIARAMAVSRRRSADGQENCRSMVSQLLDAGVKSLGDSYRPYIDDIGVIDLGQLDGSLMMTPAQIRAIRPVRS
jgi:hypothetical protein